MSESERTECSIAELEYMRKKFLQSRATVGELGERVRRAERETRDIALDRDKWKGRAALVEAKIVSPAMVEGVAATIRADGPPTCYDDRCSCIGDEKWGCLLGTTPEAMASAIIATIKNSVREPTS